MFGRRSVASDLPRTAPPRVEPAAPKVNIVPAVDSGPSVPQPTRAQGVVPTPSKPPPRVQDSRSDDYYQIKTAIFNALIDTIDQRVEDRCLYLIVVVRP